MRRSVQLVFAQALILVGGCDGGRPAGGESLSVILPRAEEVSSKGLHVEAAKLLAGKLDLLPAAEKGEARAALARFYHRANVHDRSLAAAEAARAAGVVRPEVLYHEGDARRRLHLPGAEEALEKAIELEAGYPPALLALARIRFRSSEPASALPLFERYFARASTGDLEYRTARIEHGRALREAGRHQEAADRFVSLLEEAPLESGLYSELAATLYRMRLRKEARFVEEIYRRLSQNAFEVETEDRLLESGITAFALGQRAINRTRERRFLDAFRSYSQALELDSRDPRLRSYYADLCLHFRRHGDARKVLEQAISLGLTPSSGLHWMKGRLHLEEKDPRAALASLRQAEAALAREGDAGGREKGQAPAFSVQLAMARAAVESGEPGIAEKAAASAQEIAPESWEPFYWRGRAAFARGLAADASAQLAEAARRGGESLMDLRYWAAVALEAGGRSADARAELERIVQAQPGFTSAYEGLARLSAGDPAREEPWKRACAEIRSLEKELEARRKAIDGRPLTECGADLLEMGKLLRKLRNPDAADFFLLAADLLPGNAEVHRLIVQSIQQPQDAFVRLSYLKKLLALAPDDDQVLAAIADLYVKIHARLDEAERLAGRLHELRPSGLSHRLKGEAAFHKGDRERALEILRAGAAAYPDDKALGETLARVEGGKGS